MGLAIDDSLIDCLFPNLKRKHCYGQTFPDGVIGAMSTTGYDALYETLRVACFSVRVRGLAIDVAISVADQEQYWNNTNRIYVEEIP
ncbi:hypothetical protein CK516_04235 [Nostoc sp. 'Peltigera malacea cyanobiont' DB3992]|nr:hypothetical protein CK516_04235 [Nostoc sp. 'Peltigera malacea cyanobiont' DB3992]